MQAQPERSTQLLAFVETYLKSHKRTLRSPVENVEYARSLAAARAQLDEMAFSAAWEAGGKMTPEQAIRLALEKG